MIYNLSPNIIWDSINGKALLVSESRWNVTEPSFTDTVTTTL